MLARKTPVSVGLPSFLLLTNTLAMKTFTVCLLAVVVAVQAEAPGGYSYSRPSGGYSGGGGGGGYSGGGGGGYSGGGGGGGGGYVPVPVGPSSNEGQQVDQQLLGQIRQIILQHESQSSSGGGGGGGGYSSGGPSSSYGVPSSSYGAPSSGGYSSRVVGVDLEGVQPAIQVAQYEQSSGSSGGGYSSGGGGYSSGPSSSYGAPARQPSSSYGAPF